MQLERICATPGRILGVTVVYVITGLLGLQLAFIHRSVTAVWPPTGIALAACLLLGPRVWPGVFLGAFLVNITTAGAVAAALGIACGNTLEALVGALLVHRFAHGCNAFERASSIFCFAVLAGLLSPMVSATVGGASLALGGLAGWADYGAIWWTWWLGDAMGALLVTPFILSWHNTPRWPWNCSAFVEALLVFLAVVCVGLLVFGGLFPGSVSQPLAFLAMPLLAWMAFRFGQREVTTTVIVLAGLALWGTRLGFGPFVRAAPNEALLLLQTFMGVMALTTTIVAAVVAELRQVKEAVMQLNRELEHHLDELQILLKVIPVGIGVADDPACRHIRINPYGAALLDIPVHANASLTALPAERPTTFQVERHGQEVPAEELPMQYAATHGIEVRDVEVDLVRADGQRLKVLCHATPLFDAAGRVCGCIGTMLDITARTQAEQALQHAYTELERRVEERTAELAAANVALRHEMAERQQAEEERRRLAHDTQRAEHFALLGRLAAGVSHEIRNPLGAIVLHVELLEEELRRPSPDSAAEVTAALAEMKAQLARMDDLVQDYLSLVRVANIQREVQDLEAAVQAWGAELQELAARREATLHLEGMAELGWVAFHASTLRRAVLNLVQNALDAMPSGGTVTLAGQGTATHVQLQVRDTGSGITAALLGQIFEPLYTTKSGGTGLGLYITQEIVAAHEGQLTVQSIEGQGTTFIITLPRTVADRPGVPVISA